MSPDLGRLLADTAQAHDVTTFSGAALRRAAERRRARRMTAAVAVVALALLVPTVVIANRRTTAVPATGPLYGVTYPSWSAAGGLANDPAYATAARATWDASPKVAGHGPHTAVHLLYAAPGPEGPVVVVTGLDRDGHRRIAVFQGSPYERRFTGFLRLTADTEGPDPAHTGAIVLATGIYYGVTADSVVVGVLAEPGTTEVRLYAGQRLLGSAPGSAAMVKTAGYRRLTVRTDGPAGGIAVPAVLDYVVHVQYPTPSETAPAAGSPRPVSGLPLGWAFGARQGAHPIPDASARDIDNAWGLRHPDLGATPGITWTETLPDGSEFALRVPNDRNYVSWLVVGVRSGRYVDLYVDRQLAGDEQVAQVSALVRGTTQRWLVVVGAPGVTRIAYDLGSGFRDATVYRGSAVVAAGSATTARVRAWVGDRLTYDGPVTAKAPLS